MAEGNGLLNRRAGFTGTGGSNPPLSAIFILSRQLEKVVRRSGDICYTLHYET